MLTEYYFVMPYKRLGRLIETNEYAPALDNGGMIVGPFTFSECAKFVQRLKNNNLGNDVIFERYAVEAVKPENLNKLSYYDPKSSKNVLMRSIVGMAYNLALKAK